MATLSTAERVVIKIGSALVGREWSFARRLVDGARERCGNVACAQGGRRLSLLRLYRIGARGAWITEILRSPLEQSQAAAAVGQIRLARAYEEALAPYNITAAQVLVTLEDSANRRRYLNSRATLEQLLTLGAVPIVNENDTVATDEIRFGDNDRLAAQVAVTVGADHLILLSDVDGLYTANPVLDPAATRFETVDAITPEIEEMAGDPTSGLSQRRYENKGDGGQNCDGCGLRDDHFRRLGLAPDPGVRGGGEGHAICCSNGSPFGAQSVDIRDEATRCRAFGCGGGQSARGG